VSARLLNAFKALGPGPTRREIATVASALRESGDEQVGRLLNFEEHPQDWDRCCAIADVAGAYALSRLTWRWRSTIRSGSQGLSGAKTSTYEVREHSHTVGVHRLGVGRVGAARWCGAAYFVHEDLDCRQAVAR
jgi:hypothetical protein